MAAPWLADALRAGGLPVVEEPGCHDRGTGGSFTPLGVLAHHTAGPAKGNLPSLRVVRDGLPSLRGPLSQLMLSRAGVFHVVATGRANHAGLGAASFVPNGDGNRYLIGIEAESCGRTDDWTPEQRANYPRGVAALCRHMGVSERNVLGHKEWALPRGRKIDPAFWDMNAFRAAVRTHLNSEDDDKLDDTERNAVLSTHRAIFLGGGDAGPKSIIKRLEELEAAVTTPAFRPEGATEDRHVPLGVASLNAYVGMYYGGSSTPEGKSIMALIQEGREATRTLETKLDAILAELRKDDAKPAA